MSLQQKAQEYENQIRDLVTRLIKNLQTLGLYKNARIETKSSYLDNDIDVAVHVFVDGNEISVDYFRKKYFPPEAEETKREIAKELIGDYLVAFTIPYWDIKFAIDLIKNKIGDLTKLHDYDRLSDMIFDLGNIVYVYVYSNLLKLQKRIEPLFGDYAKSKGLKSELDSLKEAVDKALPLAERFIGFREKGEELSYIMRLEELFDIRRFHDYLLEQP